MQYFFEFFNELFSFIADHADIFLNMALGGIVATLGVAMIESVYGLRQLSDDNYRAADPRTPNPAREGGALMAIGIVSLIVGMLMIYLPWVCAIWPYFPIKTII